MLLKVNKLNLYYGSKHILKDISFTLSEGEILCIVGESGSGKTSILYSILGLLPRKAKVEGEILFKGKNLMDKKLIKNLRGREISMVFQEPSLYLDPLFKIGNQVKETYEIHFDKKDAKIKALESLRNAGITDAERVYNAYPHQLSGGLKQRACIAIATVCNPSLILADEPTTALDVSVQSKVLKLFLRMKEEGKSVVLVTHDFGVVAEIADRVIVLKDGKIVEEGDVFTIFDSPRNKYTIELLKSI